MHMQQYEKYNASEVTDDMLQEATVLFNENYGVWGEKARQATGSRVRLSKDRLRAQCLFDSTTCFYTRVIVDGTLAGNAFASSWTTATGDPVCWVTQLVVRRDYRERGLAKTLLSQFKTDDVKFYGLVSSHPATCLAASRVFGGDGGHIARLEVIARHAREILETSPIGYVKDATLRGSLFSSDDTSNGLVSCVDSGFFVDHSEPLEVLDIVRQEMEWPLGDLADGHEFLIILEPRRRPRRSGRG